MSWPSGKGAWVGLLLVLGLLGLAAYRVVQGVREEAPPPTVEQLREERGIPVTVSTARLSRFRVWREHSGSVSGTREAVVGAKTDNPIDEVAVTVGDEVLEGQVLVRQSGEAAAARVRQAQAAAAQARRMAERAARLFAGGAMSEQDLEAARTQQQLAQADLAAARDPLVQTSPLTGVVTEVLAREGAAPAVGEPLVRVADLSARVVFLRLSASDAAEIAVGQPARWVELDAPEKAPAKAEGKVRRVALQADPTSRLVEVEVELPPHPALIPGTYATVEILVADKERAVVVPQAAVREEAVWVVSGEDVVSRRPVREGLSSGGQVELLEGLKPGERFVVTGGALLSEGTRVRIVEEGFGGS